jgi:hypothetical protein
VNGGGFYCLRLAGYLGRDQPFYALPSHGADDRPLPPIQAMAASHVACCGACGRRAPTGSAASVTARGVRMARLLQAQGERWSGWCSSRRSCRPGSAAPTGGAGAVRGSLAAGHPAG